MGIGWVNSMAVAPLRRILWATSVIGTTVILAGCQGGAAVSEAEAQPELVDNAGLVERYEFLLPAPDAGVLPHLDSPIDEGTAVISGVDEVDVRVVWSGLPCQTAPIVEVTRDQERVLVEIQRGPEVLEGAEAECPAAGVYFAVDLNFADDAEAGDVEARIRP